MSHGYCPFTTVAALKAADKMLGPDRAWRPTDKVQAGWLDRYYRPIVPTLETIPEIASNATAVAAEHLAFLKKHGWEAQITQCPPGQFLTAAVMDLLVEWKEEGVARPIEGADGKTYPGAVLKGEVEYWENDTGGSAACIATKTADRVWLTMLDAAPSQLDLADLAQRLIAGRTRRARHDFLHFPMVDLAEKSELDWILGLHTTDQRGQGWELAQALQQITLKMNQKGARARAADEMGFRMTSVMIPPPPLVIDKPFLVAFERPGLPQPLFTAYVEQDAWKDPGTL